MTEKINVKGMKLSKMCLDKVRHVTKKAALLSKEYEELHSDKELSIYKCPACNGWHLTTNKRKRYVRN